MSTIRFGEAIIKDTHRGLWYHDGKVLRVLEAGRYKIPLHWDFGFFRTPRVEVVLAAERMSEVQLVEARTKTAVQRIDADVKVQAQKLGAESEAQRRRLEAESEAAATAIRAEAESRALETQAESARLYATHPALLRLRELDALKELGQNSLARLYLSCGEGAPLVVASDGER